MMIGMEFYGGGSNFGLTPNSDLRNDKSALQAGLAKDIKQLSAEEEVKWSCSKFE